MIILDEAPKLILPDHYRANRPAIIRPGVDLASYFPFELDRKARRVIASELVKIGAIEDRAEARQLVEAAIPFGMFKPGAAAFPQIQTSAQTEQASGGNTTVPSGIQSGDLLILFCVISSASNTITTPSGWTQLRHSTTLRTHAVYYKTASGSETNFSIANSGSSSTSAAIYRVSGQSAAPQISTLATGLSAAPQPASLSPSWGSAKTLWFSFFYANDTGNSSTAPAGYSNSQIIGATANRAMGVAAAQIEASSEQSAAWTLLGGSASWGAYMVAVH